MAHWENRPEAHWKDFKFNQPYAKGLARLRDEVLGKSDFDPATLWQWGTMQAMALIETLKDVEARFGAEGQQMVAESIRKVGFDVGRQILDRAEIPQEITDVEFLSFFATVINRIAYASLEAPRIDSEKQASFEILWCPHQDHYRAFDCRVQRYFVQGMIDAAREFAKGAGPGRPDFEVRFEATIPAGAPTCRFTLWRATDEERDRWAEYTRLLEEKALRHSQMEGERQAGKTTDKTK